VIVCVDVDYRATAVVTACVGFEAWTDATAARELVVRSDEPAAPYTPGRFFERELPYLQAALARFGACDVIVVDGYAWLGPGRAGLGAHLHVAIGAPVVGIAKTRYLSAEAIEVVRGAGANPLYVTAAAIDAEVAAAHVRAMHGPFRIPTLVQRADALARGHAA
jgi:deoxyribonuclease V